MTGAVRLRDLLGDLAELEIAVYRHDGTLRPAVPIWNVSVRGQLAVRSYRGADGAWYLSALRTRRARISTTACACDVILVEGDPRLRAEIDGAYRSKYGSGPTPLVDQLVSDVAAATTLFLVPDSTPLSTGIDRV